MADWTKHTIEHVTNKTEFLEEHTFPESTLLKIKQFSDFMVKVQYVNLPFGTEVERIGKLRVYDTDKEIWVATYFSKLPKEFSEALKEHITNQIESAAHEW